MPLVRWRKKIAGERGREEQRRDEREISNLAMTMMIMIWTQYIDRAGQLYLPYLPYRL
jgi:hypothetical protein